MCEEDRSPTRTLNCLIREESRRTTPTQQRPTTNNYCRHTNWRLNNIQIETEAIHLIRFQPAKYPQRMSISRQHSLLQGGYLEFKV